MRIRGRSAKAESLRNLRLAEGHLPSRAMDSVRPNRLRKCANWPGNSQQEFAGTSRAARRHGTDRFPQGGIRSCTGQIRQRPGLDPSQRLGVFLCESRALIGPLRFAKAQHNEASSGQERPDLPDDPRRKRLGVCMNQERFSGPSPELHQQPVDMACRGNNLELRQRILRQADRYAPRGEAANR